MAIRDRLPNFRIEVTRRGDRAAEDRVSRHRGGGSTEELRQYMRLTGILDGFFLARPVLLVPVWGFALLGYRRGLVLGDSDVPVAAMSGEILAVFGLIAAFSISVACVHVLNQIADIDVDRDNEGFALLAQGGIGVATARWTAAVLAAGGVALTGVLRVELMLFSIAALVLGAVYSFPPFRFSGRPFFDFLANAVGYGGIAFGAGWVLAGRGLVSWEFPVASLPYVALMGGGSISSTLPDYPGDKARGKTTTAVLLGPRAAHMLALLLVAGAAGLGAGFGDRVVLLCSAGALPWYVVYTVYPRQVLMEATYKIGGALCMLVVAVSFPVFGMAAVAVFAVTWLYFRLRFNVWYPTLVPISHSR